MIENYFTSASAFFLFLPQALRRYAHHTFFSLFNPFYRHYQTLTVAILLRAVLTPFSTSDKAICGESSPLPGFIPRSVPLSNFLYSLKDIFYLKEII
jgi:hypothetical protein